MMASLTSFPPVELLHKIIFNLAMLHDCPLRYILSNCGSLEFRERQRTVYVEPEPSQFWKVRPSSIHTSEYGPGGITADLDIPATVWHAVVVVRCSDLNFDMLVGCGRWLAAEVDDG